MQFSALTQAKELKTEQNQTLSINQQTLQSLNALTLTQEELEIWLRKEVEENPLLTLQEFEQESLPSKTERDNHPPSTRKYKQYNHHQPDSTELLENIEQKRDLKSFLRELKAGESFDPEMNFALEIIIDSLDSDGYFRKKTAILAAIFNIGADKLDEAVLILQNLSPAGIGARSLEECLELQLAHKEGKVSSTERVFLKNLYLVAEGRIKELKKICNINGEEFKLIFDKIKKLNPKPGYNYTDNQTPYIIPDLILSIKKNDHLALEINPHIIPDVLLDQSFYIDIKSKTRNREEREFIQNCYKNGQSLMRNLQQRYETTLRVAHLIVEHQRDYFLKKAPLRPLLQKEVAEFLRMHESTVSRALRGRYLLSPQGIQPLAFFISTTPCASDKGRHLSAHAVKQKILGLIANEDKTKPLSDNSITKKLLADEIAIARRTVAKYREEAGLANAATRKKMHLLSSL